MRVRRLIIGVPICFLVCIAALSQDVPLAESARSSRTVFIENTSGDGSVLDASHLTLSSSRFNWTEDRIRADLVFHFDRKADVASRSETGNEIQIGIKNTYSLEVQDRSGKVIWKSSVDLDTSNIRTSKTEQAYLQFLHRTPAAKLVGRFLLDESK